MNEAKVKAMQELKCPDCGHLNPDIRELGHRLPRTCGHCPHIWRLQDVTLKASRPQRPRLVTLDQAVFTVVARHGGVRAAERATGVDKSFISRLMRGLKVAPSAETLEALGLRSVPLYEVLKTPNV